MNATLYSLRQNALDAAARSIHAQEAYRKAVNSIIRKAEMDLRQAAEDYYEAAEPYRIALRDLRQFLNAVGLSDGTDKEIERIETLISLPTREGCSAEELIECYEKRMLRRTC